MSASGRNVAINGMTGANHSAPALPASVRHRYRAGEMNKARVEPGLSQGGFQGLEGSNLLVRLGTLIIAGRSKVGHEGFHLNTRSGEYRLPDLRRCAAQPEAPHSAVDLQMAAALHVPRDSEPV